VKPCLPPSRPETLLENTAKKHLFLDALFELQAFLQQRQRETENQDDFTTNQLSMFMPSFTQHFTPTLIVSCLAAIDRVFVALQAPRLRQLLEIKASNRFLERLALSINQSLRGANAHAIGMEEAHRKKMELQETIARTYPRLSAISAHNVALKRALEQDLSAQYNNRRVSITGGDITNL